MLYQLSYARLPQKYKIVIGNVKYPSNRNQSIRRSAALYGRKNDGHEALHYKRFIASVLCTR
jgi:hypothetical protein